MTFKKLAAATALIALASGSASAVDQNISAQATFRAAVSLTKNLDMDLTPGATYIDYAVGVGASDFARLATNGTVSFAGSNFSGNTSGQAADVDISGDGASVVDISCSASATLSDGTNTLTMDQIQISMNTGDAWGSADDTCAGAGSSPLSHTLDGTDKVLMGGRISGAPASGSMANANFTTGGAGGAVAVLRVVYQ